MIYDTLIDELAALPLRLLVTPSDQQTEESEIACWCPFCKGKGGMSQTPHFIIFKHQCGGLYGTPVEHWYCPHTKRGGWGALELYAAIHGYGYWWRRNQYSPDTFICEGDDLRQACLGLAKLAGHTEEEIAEKWPQLTKLDYREITIRPIKEVHIEEKASFSVHDLTSLGCAVWLDRKNIIRYDFDTQREDAAWHFVPEQLHDDFHIYAVNRVTLPAVSRKGIPTSEVLISTPFNPIFVVYPSEDNTNVGAVFRPGMNVPPIIFSNSEDYTQNKVSRWLGGDPVFLRAVDKRTEKTTGVLSAIQKLDKFEVYADHRTEWALEDPDSDKIKYVQKSVLIPDNEIKAQSIIYCETAQNAIATYYHLKALRYSYPSTFGSRWYHVAFPFGQVPFTSVHYNKLQRFADNVTTLYDSTPHALLRAREVSCRYRSVRRAALPDELRDAAHLRRKRLYNHPVQTVRDFFLSYKMLPREAFQHDEDLNRLFSSFITSALCSDPFERKEKRDRNGVVRDVYYTINPATLWEFMASQGYARDVREDSADKIGRYVRVDGPFADELESSSMVQATIDNLRTYARQLNDARFDTPDEYELMVQAILRANKEINEKTIASLPAIHLNYNDGYGRHLEHFFYDNGALRISENEIKMVSYDHVKFNVERSEILHWNMTPIKNLPFEIQENPEYRERLEFLEAKKNQKDDNGNPLYTPSQIGFEENSLNQWAQTHRWVVDWKGCEEKDMWPSLRVLRGFANEEWEKEQNLLHEGKHLSADDQMELDCRFANLIFALGRVLWRYRETKSNCISYLIENVVSAQNRAEGGSGKSTFVRVFAGCAAHILNINGRDLVNNKEFSSNLAEYQHHKHRIVHWEDVDQTLDFGKLYNLTTGDFSVRYMYKDRITIPLSEGPGHIVTSNYPLHDLDDSTMRRVCMVGFSHRFSGGNVMKNKAARYISDIMPDFNAVSPEKLDTASRNQIAMICALAVQFVMRYDTKVDAQKKYMEQRTLTQSLGESFLRFAKVFFDQPHVFGIPVDLDSMLEEYKNTYAEASKNKNDSFSPKAFKRRILDYCETSGIMMNPPQLFVKADGKVLKKAEQTNYFTHKAWCTHTFFAGRDWEEDTTVSKKEIRELVRTEHAVYFYRTGMDHVPANNDELMARYAEFVNRPDPSPIRDDEGQIVSLTDEEKERWRSYLDGKQRKRSGYPAPIQGTASSPVNEDECPF